MCQSDIEAFIYHDAAMQYGAPERQKNIIAV